MREGDRNMIIKCKMCGGDIEFNPGDTYGTCLYCGGASAIPKAKDENRLNRYNRANHFRRQCEFDKAVSAYEKLLESDDTDAEAHWGAVLSRYGIEYVEDPSTGRRVPTCHRLQVSSILADADYLAAVSNAPDTLSRDLYKTQAAEIAAIQKDILAVSANEKPYDVFICYKEADENGRRTHDSQWAQDVYYGLTEQGYKVFFSRITLEDKLGTQYEPYIFAALNSARVMLVIGSRPEYFNAIWVKNEWSRYLALMATDRKRLLIPCYRDMDPYDLPEELSTLQSQDMSKIGFMQDLLRGVKKVLTKEETAPQVRETVVVQQSAGNTSAAAQVKRGNMALEDHDWGKAEGFFEEALNLDPECAEAYIGKLLTKAQKPGFASYVAAQKEKYSNATAGEQFWACPEDTAHITRAEGAYTVKDYLSRAEIRKLYAYDRSFTSVLSCRRQQKEQQQRELAGERLLNRAKQYAKGATGQQLTDGLAAITAALDKRIAEAQAQDAANVKRIKTAYADFLTGADIKAEKLSAQAKARREQQYKDAVAQLHSAKDIPAYEQASYALLAMNGYKDTEKLVSECSKQITRLQEEAQKAARKKRITAFILIAAAVGVFFLVTKVVIPSKKYAEAQALQQSGKYEEAITALEALDGYKDSKTQIKECNYLSAKALYAKGDYQGAYTKFNTIKGYKDVDTLLKADDNLLAAAAAAAAAAAWDVGKYVTLGTYPQTKAGTDKTAIEWLVLAREGDKALIISKYALDCKPYNTKYTDITWEKCTLRTWLNSDFYNKAFTASEQARIQTTTVDNSKSQGYSGYSTSGGNNTKDKVFLLSYAEARKYFTTDSARACAPTDYAIAQGAWTSSSNTANGRAAGAWWLRSPGYSQSGATYVYSGGSRLDSIVSYTPHVVRPALWIDIHL